MVPMVSGEVGQPTHCVASGIARGELGGRRRRRGEGRERKREEKRGGERGEEGRRGKERGGKGRGGEGEEKRGEGAKFIRTFIVNKSPQKETTVQ